MAVFAAVVILFVCLSARAARAHVSAPMVFMLAGFALGNTTLYDVEGPTIKVVAEVTLALLLFHGAAELEPNDLRRESVITGRLLLVALPLTIVLGFLLVLLILPESSVWLALLLGAALAPTDSALSSAAVLSPAVPARIRRVLSLESGLNDGIATPIVLFAIAAAAGAAESAPADHGALRALLAVLVGVAFGSISGLASGWVLRGARRRGWAEDELVPLAVVVVPLLAYYGASTLGGNGFMAAFIAGTIFGATQRSGWDVAANLRLTGLTSALLGCAAWLLFGAAAATHLSSLVRWQTVVLAILALTVMRIVPVAISLVGSGLRVPTLLFLGWFGPRGLPSVVFALIAIDGLAGQSGASTVVSTIAVTVVLSVLAHGLSAPPLAERYGRWAHEGPPGAETS